MADLSVSCHCRVVVCVFSALQGISTQKHAHKTKTENDSTATMNI